MCTVDREGFDAQFCVEVEGMRTEFVLQRFVNKWLLIITQYKKICNFFTVQFDQKQNNTDGLARVAPISYEDPFIPITIKNTFGTDTDEVRGAIKFLLNRSNLGKCPTDLVISIGLKEINGAILRQIAEILNEAIKIK